MIVNLLTEHHFEFPSVKGGCRGSSESTLVKISNCLKSHAAAQNYLISNFKKNNTTITRHQEMLQIVDTIDVYQC